MDDNIKIVPIEDLRFKKQTSALSVDLIDRITLIHHVFRDYLTISLEKTIDNFKYDKHPENEIRVWEHMAYVILTLKFKYNWSDKNVKSAIKVVLGLSAGAIQDNDLDKVSTEQIVKIWNNEI
jgi:hypothetical protein